MAGFGSQSDTYPNLFVQPLSELIRYVPKALSQYAIRRIIQRGASWLSEARGLPIPRLASANLPLDSQRPVIVIANVGPQPYPVYSIPAWPGWGRR
jgi:hypothetical protein